MSDSKSIAPNCGANPEKVRVGMNPPTKEQLCAVLMKSELNGTFFFWAHGTGGCDGPPCVFVRMKRPELDNVPDGDTGNAKADRRFYTTVDYFYVEKNCLVRPANTVELDMGGKTTKYYYRKYKDVDALASAVVRAIKRKHKVKIL